MPLPTFVFYCGNLLLLTSYLVLALLSARPGGVTGVQQSGELLRWSTVVFFGLAAALHLDMAVHTIARAPFFDEHGVIAWDFAGIIFAKMLAVGAGLIGITLDARKRRRR